MEIGVWSTICFTTICLNPTELTDCYKDKVKSQSSVTGITSEKQKKKKRKDLCTIPFTFQCKVCPTSHFSEHAVNPLSEAYGQEEANRFTSKSWCVSTKEYSHSCMRLIPYLERSNLLLQTETVVIQNTPSTIVVQQLESKSDTHLMGREEEAFASHCIFRPLNCDQLMFDWKLSEAKLR